MKKNNIFRHELNESIQANAALNCLNNRNKHKQINEVAPVVAAAGRMLLPMLRPVITKLVQKALVKIGTHARPTQVITHVMDMLTKGELAKKMAEKCGQTWNEIPSDVKKEIQDAIIAAFKKQSPQEQEETVDYAQLADDVCASYRGPLSKLDLKDSINYIVKMVAKKIGKTVDTLTPEELTAIQKAAKYSVWYVSEQEEDTLNAYYSQDEPDYENDHHGIWLIINLMRKQGMLRAQGIEGRDNVDDGNAIDKAYDLIEQKLNEEGMWIGDDDHEAERFVSFFGEEIAEEAMKSAIHNQEQEETSLDAEDFISNVVNLMEDEGMIDNSQWDTAYYTVEEMVQSNPNLLQYPSYMQFINVFGDDILSSLNNQEQEEDVDDAEDFISNVVNLMEDEGMIDESQWDAAYYTVEEMIQSNPELKQYPSYMQFINVFGDDILSSLNNQEQEETSLDTEYFSDLEEQEAYYENFRAIAELVADQIDKENGDDIANNMDTLFAIVREVWNNNPDDLYIWDFDDVQENDCYKFFDKHYEEIKNEYLKREHNNIMDATHDDLFAS